MIITFANVNLFNCNRRASCNKKAAAGYLCPPVFSLSLSRLGGDKYQTIGVWHVTSVRGTLEKLIVSAGQEISWIVWERTFVSTSSLADPALSRLNQISNFTSHMFDFSWSILRYVGWAIRSGLFPLDVSTKILICASPLTPFFICHQH
jgi:hypothetical protein